MRKLQAGLFMTLNGVVEEPGEWVFPYFAPEVGRVIGALERTGLAETTRIVYTSDHGDNIGARGMWGKSTHYDDAAGVRQDVADQRCGRRFAVGSGDADITRRTLRAGEQLDVADDLGAGGARPRDHRMRRRMAVRSSGNTEDSTARTWLLTMSLSAAKCFGRSSSQASNSTGRVGTERVGTCAEGVFSDMLRAYPGSRGDKRYCWYQILSERMATGRPDGASPQGDGRTRRWEGYRATRRAELVDAAIRAIRRHGATVGMELGGEQRLGIPLLDFEALQRCLEGTKLVDCGDWKLRIAGHTDGIGGDEQNLDLSKRRAAAVQDALVKRYGIAALRLSAAGFGKSQPKDTNQTLDGRAHNRRVELMRIP